MRKQFRELSPLADAFEVLDSLSVEVSTESVGIEKADGRLLASSVTSPIDVPGFDRSIMDGYAVIADDTVGAYDDNPVELTYGGKVHPGEQPDIDVEPGHAVEIATGAVIPSGANAVVMVEQTSRDGEAIEVFRPVTPGQNVMARGADIASGETVLRRGDRLDPRRIGLAAALGIDELTVRSRPRVGIISTGAEIIRPSTADRLAPGEIFDINSFSLANAVTDAGGEVTIFPHAADDYDVITSTFNEAVETCDIVLSTGSTSASAEDVVYRVVEDMGELLLHGIAIKPGKPTVIGSIDETAVLGLPGNPISALMTFRLFGRRLLDAEANAPTVEAKLSVAVDSEFGRTQLLPVGLVESPGEGLLVYDVDKGSGAITSLAEADGFIQIDDNVNYLDAGEMVSVQLLASHISPPDVLIGGEFCPGVDQLLDRDGPSTRWLADGAVDGARKLRDRIVDIAGVNLGDDTLGVEPRNDIERIACFERHVVLAHRGTFGLGSLESILEQADVLGTTGQQTGLYHRLETLDTSASIRTFPSQQAALRAVTEGEVDAALVLEAVTDTDEFDTVSVMWEPFDILVDGDRREKPGVTRLVEEVTSFNTEMLDGYRPPGDTS